MKKQKAAAMKIRPLMMYMALVLLALLVEDVQCQNGWSNMVESCYESRLVKKDFYKENKDVTPSLAGKIPRLYLISAIIAQIMEAGENYLEFSPTQYQLASKPTTNTNQKLESPAYYLTHQPATTKFVKSLRKAGVIGEASESKLVKEIDAKRLLHPYYAACAAALCVINETYHEKTALLSMVDYFSSYLPQKEIDTLKASININRANPYAILSKLDGFRPVTLYKIETATDLLNFVKKQTLFTTHQLIANNERLEVVMDSTPTCIGTSMVQKKYIFSFDYDSEYPIAMECPTDWSGPKPKINTMELYQSPQFLQMLTQMLRDYDVWGNQRVVYLDITRITSRCLLDYSIENLSAQLTNLLPFHVTTMGWWKLPYKQYEAFKDKPQQLENGLEFPILVPPDYEKEKIFSSKKKWAIYKTIASSGAFQERYQPTFNMLKREFTYSLLSDTISALFAFNLLAKPNFNTCVDAMAVVFKENPTGTNDIHQAMRCLSYGEFKMPSITNQMTKTGGIEKMHFTYPGDDNAYSFTIDRSNFCLQMIRNTAISWKKSGKAKRQFCYMPETGSAGMSYILYLSPDEAYKLQESLNYLIRPF